MTRLKVTLRRSAVTRPRDQQDTIKGLGLRHIGQSRTLENTPAVRGMVKKVLHLVAVEEVQGETDDASGADS
jgi:large subunit ribosomal protein L30